jgi:hypothetical protein
MIPELRAIKILITSDELIIEIIDLSIFTAFIL